MEAIATRVTQFPTGDRSAESIDAVFVLDRGFVLNFGDGHSVLTTSAPGLEESLHGYYYEQTDAMMMFMRWLPLMLATPISQPPVLPRYLLANLPIRADPEAG
jgi:hypothetical protein